MTAKKGMYVNSWDYDGMWIASKHAVKAQKLRRYAKKSLGLVDANGSDTKARTYGVEDERQLFLKVDPKGSDCRNPNSYCGSHLIPADDIRKFCMETLGMEEVTPTVVTVTVEVPVITEVGMLFSFEDMDILSEAMWREQHATNDALRQAYNDGDIERIRLCKGRMDGIKSLMDRLGVQLDTWLNNPAWIVEAHIPDPNELTLFAKGV